MPNETPAVSPLMRYEIIIPLRYNDDTAIHPGLHEQTFGELALFAGAASFETQAIRGIWFNGDHPQAENNNRVFVDAPDNQDTLDWFVAFKDKLKKRYQQLDIWMTRHPIELVK